LRSHGEGTTRYDVLRTGMNGRMDTLQAAVLLCKLEMFDADLAARRRVAALYDAALADAVTIPVRVADSTSIWAAYSILLPNAAARDSMAAKLKAAGVPTAIYYPRPLHHQPAYAGAHDGCVLPVSEDLCGRIMSLPIYPDLPDAAVERICAAVLA
jgi:dTDP-4-amino-4,6-dideoxygalactose transaminase